MKDLTEQRKGERSIFLAAFLWSFFPIVTVLSYAVLPSLVSLAWSTSFATLFFAGTLTYRKKWSDIRNPLLWKYALLIALFIGVLFYGLYYAGLERTTPGNAAIIVLFEVFTSYVFFRVFKGERFSLNHVVGAILMIVGAVIVVGHDFSGINTGNLLILLAVMFSPIGNFFQQKARHIASSEAIMFLRSLLSAPIIFLLAYLFHAHASLGNVYASLPILAINGLLLLGLSKIFWIEAIHRISVTKGIALSSVTPFLTLLLAWLILQQTPNVWQLTSLIPLVGGVLLLTDQFKLKV